MTDAGIRHHFRLRDVLEPPPTPIRTGMTVDFRPAVNPAAGRHAGKPIALELRFGVA